MTTTTTTTTTTDALPTALPTYSRHEQREHECLLRIIEWEAEVEAGVAEAAAAAGCPVSWDQVHCWPPSPAGALAVAPCIDELNGVYYDTTQNATRWCFANGTWDNYSNYSQCGELVAPPPPSDAATTLAFFFAGFCLSLFALGVAIWIFLYFKDLRCLRNTIHTNLMVTYILYDSTWILNACIQGYVSNLVTCNILVIFIHYFYLTNFFWMFVEGLYLFILVVATFTGEKIKLRIYISIGWGFPAAIVVTWATAKHFGQLESSDTTLGDSRGQKLLLRHCPWMASDDFDWIHEAPVITILATNLAFLVSIMWVLITKLRSTNTPETKQYRKATKALLVLFPLLGITYILMMQGPMEGVAGDVFRNTRALLVGLQGFTVALFYCFLNTEVQNTLRHRMDRWKESRAVGIERRNTLSQSRDCISRSRTESIRLADLLYSTRPSLDMAGHSHKRASAASHVTVAMLPDAEREANAGLEGEPSETQPEVACVLLSKEGNAV